MKTFVITEEAPVICIWTYIVEAETEEEALELVTNGDVEAAEMNIEVDYEDAEFTYHIEEEEAK
jgi:hypothetical protein